MPFLRVFSHQKLVSYFSILRLIHQMKKNLDKVSFFSIFEKTVTLEHILKKFIKFFKIRFEKFNEKTLCKKNLI